MPKEVYLNMTELAQLLINKGRMFSRKDRTVETRAFFDAELKNQGKATRGDINTPYGRFYETAVALKPLNRVLTDLENAKSKPDSTMAKRFLRDVYQIVYYMLGDEKSGFKPEMITDKKLLDEINIIRMKNVKSLTEKLQLALDSESIDFSTFRSVTDEFATALHNNKPRAYDKKLVDLVEAKLVKTANDEIKKVDLSPDGMDNQAGNLYSISRVMTETINKLYPEDNISGETIKHKQELLTEWNQLNVTNKAYSAVQHPKKEHPVVEQPKQEIKTPETAKQEVPQVKVGLFKRAAINLKNKWFKKNMQTIGKGNEK